MNGAIATQSKTGNRIDSAQFVEGDICVKEAYMHQEWSWERLTAYALSIVQLLLDCLSAACVFSYYSEVGNPSRYQYLQGAMLLLIAGVTLGICQYFALRMFCDSIPPREQTRHRAIALLQFYFLLAVMVGPALFN